MRWTAWPSVFARVAAAGVVCAGAACGGAAPPAAQPVAVAAPPRTAPPPAGPSERECDELITHAVALGIDEPGAPVTTEADHEAVRRQLHEEVMNGCRGLPRDAFRCALEAASLPALAACQPPGEPGGDQRRPSSSTSNSKVAPGGITPPAPRSP